MQPCSKEILKLMMEKCDKGISVADVSRAGITSELRTRVSELQRNGYTIKTIWERNKKNNGKHKIYILENYPLLRMIRVMSKDKAK